MSSLQEQVDQMGPWFHNIHLPDGTQTCPQHVLGDYPSFKWKKLEPHLPSDLHGWHVLDLGCNAGFYSLELARKGATVTALDADPHYLNQARWAAAACGLTGSIEFEERQVYSLAGTSSRWDLVLFLGVLYHLRYPMLGLDIVARCAKRTLILQCLTAPGSEPSDTPDDLALQDRQPLIGKDWPRLSFVERKLAGDRTNWWVPNAACLEAMLRSSGMRIVSRPMEEFYVCEPQLDSQTSMWTWNSQEFWAVARGCPDESLRARTGAASSRRVDGLVSREHSELVHPISDLISGQSEQ